MKLFLLSLFILSAAGTLAHASDENCKNDSVCEVTVTVCSAAGTRIAVQERLEIRAQKKCEHHGYKYSHLGYSSWNNSIAEYCQSGTFLCHDDQY